MQRGKFIVFEGIDGSGKSTQLKMLADVLREKGVKCVETLEPTYGTVGTVLHDILSGKVKADPKVTAALFVADRLDHLTNSEKGVLKLLNEGTTVICDRYYFSSYAYQSVEVPSEWVIDANRLAAETLRPDCTIFIDVSPKVAMTRISQNRETTELYETEERLTAVREGYIKAFEKMKNEEKIKIFDGDKAIDEIAEEIKEFVVSEFF
ncbi:MAG: dTMP kinase [Ruminococcaceae bacterium]|nr:dTMP kinase [Oscillospiraceae bacterium]